MEAMHKSPNVGQLHHVWHELECTNWAVSLMMKFQGNALNWALWKCWRIEENWGANDDHGNKPPQLLSQKQVKWWVGQNTEAKRSWAFLYPQCSVSKLILAIEQETWLPVQLLTLLLPFELFFKTYYFAKFYSSLPYYATPNTDALFLYIPHLVQTNPLMLTACLSK